jgi:hypothetical protein
LHLHGSPQRRLRRLCLLFHHRPVWGRPPVLPRHSAGTSRVRCWLHQGGVAQRHVYGGIALFQYAIVPPPHHMLRSAAVVGSEGVAPSHPCGPQLLGLVRLLFRHEPSWCPRLVLPQRPPACRAGALLAELRGRCGAAGWIPTSALRCRRPPFSALNYCRIRRACRTRTGVWLLERELSLAARRTPRTGGATGLCPRSSALRVARRGDASTPCDRSDPGPIWHRAAVLPCAPGGTSSVCRFQHLRGMVTREGLAPSTCGL